jgi:hypothetical protein
LGFGFGLVTLGFLTAVREAGDGVDVDAAVPRRFCCDCGVVFGDGDGVARACICASLGCDIDR